MRSPFLRKFRILFSAIVFVCFFLIFVDFKNLIPASYIDAILYLQFIPSILNYIDLRSIASAGFIAVLILTLLSGRTYCSFLCPLGIGEDLFSRIGGRIKRKFRRFGFRKPHTLIRYSLLFLTVILAAVWGVFFLSILDPYSIFGRFMTHFAKPAVIVINNFISGILHKFDVYTLDHITITGFKLLTYTIPAIFFLIIGFMSLTKGRLYCNMICPVGTLLGFISKVSVFRIKFDESKCNKCGRCSVGCKSSCIDSLQKRVDVSRCVDCFNCINVCQEKALSYGVVRLKKTGHVTDTGKRKFVAGSLLMLFGLPQLASAQDKKTPVPKKQSTVREDRTTPICPPGGGSNTDFNIDCTACSLCISACPNGVLQPALLQYGFVGMMQPVMDYHKSFCTYNCTRCTEVCPTNALRPLLIEAKKLTQIGQVHFIKDNCIVKTEKTACGACSEACPTKAVYMIPYEGNLLIPETKTDICVGCGHCEYACPTTPFKAIFVDGNEVHQVAKKPENEQSGIETPVEFPF
jgi:ferredoxin